MDVGWVERWEGGVGIGQRHGWITGWMVVDTQMDKWMGGWVEDGLMVGVGKRDRMHDWLDVW